MSRPVGFFEIRISSPRGLRLIGGEGDYVAAVNKIAAAFIGLEAFICVLAFVKDSVRFIARGEYADILKASRTWIKNYGQWVSLRRGIPHPLQGAPMDIRRLWGPLELKYCVESFSFGKVLPSGSKWRFRPSWLRKQIAGTHKEVPEGWAFTPDGMVAPESFIRPELLTYG